MGISLNPKHLKLYRNLALLFLKYGQSDVVRNVGLDEALGEDDTGASFPFTWPEDD